MLGYNALMKNLMLISIVLFVTGCTQVVTAPIAVAGTAVSTSIKVADAAVDTVIDEEKED